MPRQGESLGKYNLLRRIGLGGMAEVWLARVTGPGGFAKSLVVKTVLEHHAQNQEFIAQFFDEARLAALLTHPNIAQIFELGEHKGIYFIAMEYVKGQDFQALRKAAADREGGLPSPLLARIACGVCEGLHYAHELADDDGQPLNLVHRDVSPENILISYDGIVKIVDFGIAKASINQVTTKAGLFKGKLQYAAPQRLLNMPIDRRDDLYSLGGVLYKAATGVPPINADSDGGMIKMILDADFPPPREVTPTVPVELERIILKCMEWDPQDRYQTAREIQRDLEHFIAAGGQPITTFEVSQFTRRCFAEEIERASMEIAAADKEPQLVPSEADKQSTVFGLGGQQKSIVDDGTVMGHVIDDKVPQPIPDPALSTNQLEAGWKPRRGRGVILAIMVVSLLAVGIGIGAWAPWRDHGADASEGSRRGPVGGGPRVDAAPRPDSSPSKAPPPPNEVATINDDDGGALFANAGDGAIASADADRAETAAAVSVADISSLQPDSTEGTLTLEGPGGCTAHLGDRALGSLPLETPLPAGRHEIQLRCLYGARRQVRVTIRAGETTEETIHLRAGSLQLLVRPWAEVFIDGRRIGITPLAPITLAEGRHTVRLVNSEINATKTKRVRIRPGQRETLRVRLR